MHFESIPSLPYRPYKSTLPFFRLLPKCKNVFAEMAGVMPMTEGGDGTAAGQGTCQVSFLLQLSWAKRSRHDIPFLVLSLLLVPRAVALGTEQ